MNSAALDTLRDRLQQLKSLHAEGLLDAAAYEAAKAPLERQLLDLVLASPAAVVAAVGAVPKPLQPAPPRPSRGLVAGLSAVVLGIASAGYWWTGSPGMPSAGTSGTGTVAETSTAPDGEAGSTPAEEQQFAAMVDKLAANLKEEPGNAEGWSMLARSYARLRRFGEAVPAYAKAVALRAPDADLLADYADSMAMNNRRLDGEPTQLIERALQINPEHIKSLALAGAAAFDRKDYAAAVRHWEKLSQVAPPDSGYADQVRASLDQARELAGLPKAQTAKQAAAVAAAVTAVAAAPSASATGTAATAAAAGAAVQGSVRLAPALAKLAAPTDTVFVYARAAEGPRMPLAILRYQVKDLPLSFKLDDSTAMSPALRLSLHQKVVITARISKGGQAVPAAGDLAGQSPPVANDAKGVDIEITEVLKN